MTKDDLVDAVGLRARNPSQQTDYIAYSPRALPAPASGNQIAAAERELGVHLHPFHRRVLCEIANGGFGPGDGLVGLQRGAGDSHGWFLPELSRMLSVGEAATRMPPGCVPLCEWGDGMWTCVDSVTGVLVELDQFGPRLTPMTLERWLAEWANGRPLRPATRRGPDRGSAD